MLQISQRFMLRRTAYFTMALTIYWAEVEANGAELDVMFTTSNPLLAGVSARKSSPIAAFLQDVCLE